MHISPVKNRPHQSVRSRLVKCAAISLSFLLALPAHAETITYQHDNNGNITQRGTTTFAYDALNRLIGEAGPAKTQTITYDENGNRKSDGAGSYTYETGSNRMLTRRGLSVTTDSLGNITADGTGRTYTRNQANQLYQVFQNGILLATYYYDGNGRRTRKVTTASAPQGAQTIFYGYDDEGHLISELSGTGAPLRTYVWQDDAPLAQIEYQPSRKIYYFNVDHLNTPRSLMDDTGKIVWRWESDAFGSTLPNEDVDGDGVKITSNLRFPGQYYDKETGLHYNWHRYYDPTMGQYIEPDPLGLAAGINLYAYVQSAPLNWADPTGLDRLINPFPAGKNGPRITFNNDVPGGPSTNLPVSNATAEMVENAVRSTGASININSTTKGKHGARSRHYRGMACDIDQVNGAPVTANNPLARAFQEAFQNEKNIRENFGPFANSKTSASGDITQMPQVASQHKTHIHVSGQR